MPQNEFGVKALEANSLERRINTKPFFWSLYRDLDLYHASVATRHFRYMKISWTIVPTGPIVYEPTYNLDFEAILPII